MNPARRIHRAWRDFIKEYTVVAGPVERGGYYIDSPDLWEIRRDSQTERMHFIEGVLFYNYPILGIQPNPAYIAWYGLINLNIWIETKEERFFDKALVQGKWLADNAVPWKGEKGAIRWEYGFDFADGDTFLNAPWPSAMAQGLAISLLVRLFRVTGETDFIKTAKNAVRLYEIPIEDGGVAADLNGGVYFEEYPAYPLTLVLDGTLFSLLGLYDISREDDAAKKLFQTGVKTLDRNWKLWDWNGVWSRYGRTGFFSSMLYHRLNCLLLRVFQDKGYLNSFPLRGWEKGLRLRKTIAIYQMYKIAAAHLLRYFSKNRS